MQNIFLSSFPFLIFLFTLFFFLFLSFLSSSFLFFERERKCSGAEGYIKRMRRVIGMGISGRVVGMGIGGRVVGMGIDGRVVRMES